MFDRESLKIIEEETGLITLDGLNISITFLPIVLESIYLKLNKDLKSQEVLIIGDDEELTKKVIKAIYKYIRFITISGKYTEENIDNIYEYALEDTGLSIFYSKKIDKILTNYSIIINLIDDCNINLNNFRNRAIAFDLSISKEFSKNVDAKFNIIEGFAFKKDDCKIGNKDLISSLFHSHIYEQLNRIDLRDFMGIYSCGQFYTVEAFASYNINMGFKL